MQTSCAGEAHQFARGGLQVVLSFCSSRFKLEILPVAIAMPVTSNHNVSQIAVNTFCLEKRTVKINIVQWYGSQNMFAMILSAHRKAYKA